MAANRDIEVILLRKRLHQERLLFGCITFSLILFIWLNHTRDTVYEVRLGKRPLAWLASDHSAASVIQRVRQDLQERHGSSVRFREEAQGSFSVERLQGTQRPAMTESEARQAIATALTPEVKAAQIVIDGRVAFTVKTREMADTALAAVRSALLDDQEGLIGAPTWKQQVTVREAYARPDAVAASVQSVIDALMKGMGAQAPARFATYTVKSGDRAWSIARNLGIAVDELQRLNPGADFSRLLVGQVLKTSRPAAGRSSMLTLVTRRRKTFVESVPAPVREIPSGAIPRGERRVQSAGRPGKLRVTAEVREENGVLVEERRTVVVSLLEPVPTIVLVGQAVSSRPADNPRTPDNSRRPSGASRLPPPAPARS